MLNLLLCKLRIRDIISELISFFIDILCKNLIIFILYFTKFFGIIRKDNISEIKDSRV